MQSKLPNKFALTAIGLMALLPMLFMGLAGCADAARTVVSAHVDDAKGAVESAEDRMAALENHTVNVVFAVRDIPKGRVIVAEDVATRDLKEQAVPAHAVQDSAAIVGDEPLVDISENQIITAELLKNMSKQVKEDKSEPAGDIKPQPDSATKDWQSGEVKDPTTLMKR